MDDELLEPEPSVFYPNVYDGDGTAEAIPDGFNAVRIGLDACLTANLDWKAQHQTASQLSEKGLKFLWDIDLGLFDKLVYPIDHEMQFQALMLSLVHFRDSLWNAFRDQTIGLCLYTGSADFSTHFPWDETQRTNLHTWQSQKEGASTQLFCSDVAAEYLCLFARQLPDALTLFVRLDAEGISDPLLRAQLLIRERFNRIQLAVKGSQGNVPNFGWNDQAGLRGYIGRETLKPAKPVNAAVCFPGLSTGGEPAQSELSDVFNVLDRISLPYRVIPENELTTEWDGLDYVFFTSQALNLQTKRKLQGFCAAGGTAVTAGDKIGLPQEINLAEFKSNIWS